MPGGTSNAVRLISASISVLAQLRLGSALARFQEIAANPVAKIPHGLELSQLLGEGVVELGKVAPLHAHHVRGEQRLLAGQMRRAVILRKAHPDLPVLAGGRSLELLLEAGNEALGAELHDRTFRAAPVEGLAVDAAGVVDHQRVARCGGGPLRLVEQRSAALPQSLELHLDILDADFDRRASGREPFDVGQTDLGLHLDTRPVSERRVVLQRIRIDGRLADRNHAALIDRFRKGLRHQGLLHLLGHGGSVELLENRTRRLSRPKSAHPNPAAQIAIGAVEGLAHSLGVDFDLEGRNARSWSRWWRRRAMISRWRP